MSPDEEKALAESLQWIWDVRAKHYEEAKNMTPEEHAELVRRKTDPVMARHGWKDSTHQPVKPNKPIPAPPVEAEAEPAMAGAGAAVSHY
jgi:hypothetical protein